MSLRIAFVSTFPPTQCGLATFTAAQVAHLQRHGGVDVGVVSVVDHVQPDVPGIVVHQWAGGQHGAVRRAASVLDRYDAVILQHEYGIFAGPSGDEVVELLSAVSAPVITVLHTVLAEPTPEQRRVLQAVVERSAVVVTMTRTARDRLLAGWDVRAPVHVIPHGAEPNPHHPQDPPRLGPPVILTWGLIGPGKGIEWAIEALAGLRDLADPPRYRIVGQTHPRVLEREGEAYRQSLIERARALGVDRLVQFDGGYRDSEELRRIARRSDVILLPYDSREQVTSGVLVEAVVAGRPVVSTAFPHARELLSDGAGLLVSQRDPAAMGRALRLVLTEPALRRSMARRARELAPSLHWGTVMDRFVDVARGLADRKVPAVS